MKSRLIKFVVPLLALLILIGATVGVVNKLSAAHAAAVSPSACGWQRVQDAWVAPRLGSHLAESQMYHSTCSGAVYCRLIDHSTTVRILGVINVYGSATATYNSVNIPPRGHANSDQLNETNVYACGGYIRRSDSSTSYDFRTANVTV